jgi:formate hydrogenlyase transcriptional activator
MASQLESAIVVLWRFTLEPERWSKVLFRTFTLRSKFMRASPIKACSVINRGTSGQLISSQAGLREVWSALQIVARTDSTVLIQGETGTGKELVARTLHEQGLRSNRPFIKVNCAAMPAGLLESELFGHERGAFTGAVVRTDGRFYQAHTGTLLLDEIGDLPLELQPKLLRVLQDQEFELLGSSRTIRVDVRVVAATNQNLQQMVLDRRFRADLFYRLNVFPIVVPPLRERCNDIPLLVKHFLSTLASRMDKEVLEVADSSLKMLKYYSWPGNVRELQNLIERAVIRSNGRQLEISAKELIRDKRIDAAPPQTLAEAERDYILEVLRQSGGVVAGRDGAAARLGLPRTTLLYRMQKLGISHKRADASVREAAKGVSA